MSDRASRKTGKPFVAECVFVEPDQLWLGATEPAGVEMTIGHVFSPTGPRSIVGYQEFVQHATLEFRVLTMRDCLTPEQWADLWVHGQENGKDQLTFTPTSSGSASADAPLRCRRPFRAQPFSDNACLSRAARSGPTSTPRSGAWARSS